MSPSVILKNAPKTAPAYTVNMEAFEGPLDLLLSLIERRELPITELSISQVTQDYLTFTASLESVSSVELSWFLDIATQLLVYKSRALSRVIEPDIEEAVKFEDIAARLKRLQVLRAASRRLQKTLASHLDIAGPGDFWQLLPPRNLSAKILARTGEALMLRHRSTQKPPRHSVSITKLDIASMIKHLLATIKESVVLDSILRGTTKSQTVTRTLATLELIKSNRLEIHEKQGVLHVQPNQ